MFVVARLESAHGRRSTARTVARGLIALLSALALWSPAPALGQSADASVAVQQTDARIRLDGHLDEAEWQTAEVATGFLQRQPDTGQPASERTEVRILHDGSTLYVGVYAYDDDPDGILAMDMRRDGEGGGGGFGSGSGAFRNDDSFALVLDTFLDRRNGFYFETNPTGARADALIENEGGPSFEWDGVWNVAARRVADGWTAEFAIPFSTLRFDPQVTAWGINFRRLIRRKSEEVVWAPVGIDAELSRMSLAGNLTGMGGLDKAVNLRIKPFAAASSGRDFIDPSASSGEDFDGGLDLLRWGINDSLTLDVTANTDFAQVEADDQQVNLTRFSLFFPEKREFFLENAGIFDFGPGGGGGGGGFRGPTLRMFFSRRIGLTDGGIVPIRTGARLSGRIGGWNVGLLDVQTGEQESVGAPSTNWGVVRAKRNIGERSSIGALFTNRQSGGDDWNRVLGLDADINPTRRLNFNGFIARSSDADAESGFAGGAGFRWRGSVWQANADVLEIRDEFNPEMGFLPRGDIRRYNYSVNYEPRPENNLGVRNLTFNQRTEIITNTDGTLETVDATMRFFGFDLRSGDRVTLFGSYQFERLFEDFEITDGVIIPPGDYEYWDVGVFFRTDGSRPVSFFGFYTKGGFFEGSRFQGTSELTVRVNRFVSTATNWNYNSVDLPFGAFKTNLVRQRINVAFSPNLFWNTLVQYNDASDLLTLNSRFNWIYKPGADLFLVYNQDWETGDGGMPANRAVILKFTYLLTL